MAGKIKIGLNIKCEDGLSCASFDKPISAFDQVNRGHDDNNWDVATALTNFVPVNVPNPGYTVFQNTDLVNPVEIGYNDGGTLRGMITLEPKGGLALFKRKSGRTIAGIASIATVRVRYYTLET